MSKIDRNAPSMDIFAVVLLIASIGLVIWGSVSILTKDSTPTPGPNMLKVTQEEFGEEWPFSIPEATIECMRGYAIVIHIGYSTYGLNGVAEDAGYESIRFSQYWLDDPELGAYDYKISLSPVIQRGVDFCH